MNIDIIITTLAVLAAAAVAAVGWRMRLTGQLYWRRIFAVTSFIALACVLGVIPLFRQNVDSEIAANTDVVFLVDTSYSMNALDGRDGDSRLTDIQHDIARFAEELEGSRIGMIVYDTSARIYLPLTTTSYDITSSLETLSTSDYFRSYGDTSLAGALETTKSYFEKLQETDATRNKVLVVMTDGELTGREDTAAKVQDAARALRPLVDSALVIGYGTAQGGALPIIETDYSDGTLRRTDETAYEAFDGRYQEIISKRDENLMRDLAASLGGRYLPSQDATGNANSIIDARAEAASRQASSPENRALRQNMLHVPAALLIIAWLAAFEIVRVPKLHTFVTSWKRGPQQ